MNDPISCKYDYMIYTSPNKNECTCQATFTLHGRRRGMLYNGGASTHVGEVKNVQLILKLAKSLLIKWLGENVR